MNALKQRVHPTWVFTAVCVGFLLGVFWSRYLPPVGVIYLAAGCLMLGLVFWQRRVWMIALAFLAGVSIGLWRGGQEVMAESWAKSLVGTDVRLEGKVAEDPEQKNGLISLKVDSIKRGDERMAGRLYVTIDSNLQLRREDKIEFSGKLLIGQGNALASVYRATLLGSERPNNPVLDVRDRFAAAVRGGLQEPGASLGLGILAGQKTDLPSSLSESLKIAGLTHIVVASGYNLTILIRLSKRLFSKVSRYQAALWSVLLVLMFVVVTGFSASMVRAGIVSLLGLCAWYFGRKFHPVTLLLLAASLTVVYQPNYVWGDIGWALSFAAFAGVMILAPLLMAYFYGEQKPGFMGATLVETLSAQILTLPILVGVFGQFSIVAIFSNLITLPLIPFVMLATFLAGLSQMLIPSVAGVASWLAQALLDYFVWAVSWTASFPWAQIKWQMPTWGVVVAFMAIATLCVVLKFKTKLKLRQVSIVE